MIQKLLMLLLISTISIGLKAQEKTINKSYDGIKEIKLSTSGGNCKIIKGGPKVEVELSYSYDDDIFNPVLEKEG